jgi:DNA-binding LytR/AlgR family response regulator
MIEKKKIVKDKILLSNSEGAVIVRIEQIQAVQVSDHWCTFYFDNDKKFGCSSNLQTIQDELPDYFYKISKKTIINTEKIFSINARNQKIKLQSGLEFSYIEEKMPLLKKMLYKNSTLIVLNFS